MTARHRVLLCLPVLCFLQGCSASDSATTNLPDPGPATLRRLTRTEYNNTVRDLLGNDQHLGDRFPDDDVANGFDNIGQVLSVSPLHVDMWQRAAEALADEVVRQDGAPVQLQFGPDKFQRSAGVIRRGDDLVITTTAEINALFDLPYDGSYSFTVRAYEDHAGTEVAQMAISIDRRTPIVIPVMATADMPQVYKVQSEMFAGPHYLSVAFTNPNPSPGPARNLAVSWGRVEGPAGKEKPNPQRAKLLTCMPEDESVEARKVCARQVLGSFARRAWRRAVTPDEVERLVDVFQVAVDEEDDFVAGIRVALQAVLLSPHFVYRVELDPDPSSGTSHPLNSFELATRLSYFLWSSTPDDELLNQAATGGLASPEGITAQVERMLADPRVSSLVNNFAAQWLALRSLDSADPDIKAYPSYKPSLRTAMTEETLRFLGEFFPQPGAPTPSVSLLQLPSAAFTYVNQELAEHYGLPVPPTGMDWAKVPLEGTARRGLLTQGSVLMMNSYPSRTSPVRRGKWVLEQLLCTPPPPPPPDVIGDFGNGPATGSLRHRFEQHRANALCASCHKMLDPPGFALENFDGIGSYRTMDGGEPVDASGSLPDGKTFKDATELAVLLASDPQIGRCALEKMFTYALGRAPTSGDFAGLEKIHGELLPAGYLARDVVMKVALSQAFNNRRGDVAPKTKAKNQPVLTLQGGVR